MRYLAKPVSKSNWSHLESNKTLASMIGVDCFGTYPPKFTHRVLVVAAGVAYLHDITTTSRRQTNHANKVLKEVEYLYIEDLNYSFTKQNTCTCIIFKQNTVIKTHYAACAISVVASEKRSPGH